MSRISKSTPKSSMSIKEYKEGTNPLEKVIQQQVVKFFRSNYSAILTVSMFKNGGFKMHSKRNFDYRMGETKGASDLFFHSIHPNYAGKVFFAEMKRKGGRPSSLQNQFIENAIKGGHGAGIFYDAESCIEAVKKHFNL